MRTKIKRVNSKQHKYEIKKTYAPKCVICQYDVDEIDETEEKNELMFLPCCHVFHLRCIVPWLNRNITCPECRIPIFIDSFEQLDVYNKYRIKQYGNTELIRNNVQINENSVSRMFMQDPALFSLNNVDIENYDKFSQIVNQEEQSLVERYRDLIEEYGELSDAEPVNIFDVNASNPQNEQSSSNTAVRRNREINRRSAFTRGLIQELNSRRRAIMRRNRINSQIEAEERGDIGNDITLQHSIEITTNVTNAPDTHMISRSTSNSSVSQNIELYSSTHIYFNSDDDNSFINSPLSLEVPSDQSIEPNEELIAQDSELITQDDASNISYDSIQDSLNFQSSPIVNNEISRPQTPINNTGPSLQRYIYTPRITPRSIPRIILSRTGRSGLANTRDETSSDETSSDESSASMESESAPSASPSESSNELIS